MRSYQKEPFPSLCADDETRWPVHECVCVWKWFNNYVRQRDSASHWKNMVTPQSSSTVGVMVTPLLIWPHPIKLGKRNKSMTVQTAFMKSGKYITSFWSNCAWFLIKGCTLFNRTNSWIKMCLPPMFLHSATQGDLLPHLCAHRVSEHNLGQISFHCTHTASCRQRANVYHQHLILRQLLNLFAKLVWKSKTVNSIQNRAKVQWNQNAYQLVLSNQLIAINHIQNKSLFM